MRSDIIKLSSLYGLNQPLQRGIYDMPFDCYKELNNVSRSDLLQVLKSPAHFIHAQNQVRKPSKAFEFGTAVHTFIESIEMFRASYVKCPVIDRRTKAGKEQLAELKSRNPGKIVLDTETYERAENAAQAVLLHPVARQYLNKCDKELTVIGPGFTEWDYNFKVRLDGYSADKNVILDFKTTQDASHFGCIKSITNYKYYLQAAMYTDVFEQEAGITIDDYICIFVESEAPHGVSLIRMSQEAMAVGSAEWRKAAKIYLQALRTDDWHGYDLDIHEYNPPRFIANQFIDTETNTEMFI